MNANSSSGAKKATNRTVSSVITRSRTSNMKKKTVTAINSNEGSYANCNAEPNMISNVEIEGNATSNVEIESSAKKPFLRSNKWLRYTKPTLEEIETVRGNSRVISTHKATEVWVKALEEFHSDIGYKGKIEEIDSKEVLENQLSRFVVAMKRKDGGEYHFSSIRNCMAAIWWHLNQHSVMPKPVEILNSKVYFDLNVI
ncbi:10255_t:CDS:2, partial [Racocetra persica]